MTRERTPRTRARRPGPAVTPAAHPGQGAPSLVRASLGAVFLGVPLAVLPAATGPYDDPKAWALPILVALTVVAWLARAWTSAAPITHPASGASRVAVLVLAFLGWSIFTTAISVAPAQSVLGNFGRGVGMLTLGCTALMFFLARSEFRTPGAVRSLIDVTLLGSVPTCVLALAQAAGWDPLPKAWDPAVQTLTVRSTFGTHVFLGSYLVALVPLTAARLAWVVGDRLESGRWIAPTHAQARGTLGAAIWVAGAVGLIGLATEWPILWWALVPWGVVGGVGWARLAADGRSPDTALTACLLGGLLTAQVLVVVVSRGRGAFIGLLVGLGVAGFALLIRHRAWRVFAVASAGSVALVAFVVLLNVPGSPVGRLRSMPLLSRLGDIANVQTGSPGWVRVQLWKGIADGWRRHVAGEELIPGQSPRLRSLVGYGPETQLIVLEPLTAPFAGRLVATGEGWQARYVFDRAHSAVLDLVVTEGLVGAALWLVVVCGVVVVAIARLRSARSVGEMTVRAGALGALAGHVADSQVGMVTPMSLALFWIAAAVATADPWAASAEPERAPVRTDSPARWWSVALVAAVAATCIIAWTTSRWLLASTAYARGVRNGIAGQLSDAYGDFRRSVALAPWLALPAESAAYTALRLATAERVPSRRVVRLHEAETLLRQARTYAIAGPGSWALSAQIAFAESRTGEPSQLAASRQAFDAALRLRPDDPRLLAQSALVWLESGDALKARGAAERALAREPREWVAWAVLARVSRALGDGARAEQAAGRARDLAPREARSLLDGLLN